MPIGFIRRLARLSLTSAFTPTLDENWTTQETTTYDDQNPADSPAPWGGTVADLDRVLTATGSGHSALGLLATFINKPEPNNLGQTGSLAGAIVKVSPTYGLGSTAAMELWSLQGSTWTKRRRVPLATICRSGETVVLDLTGPVLATAAVDAYWITMAPDLPGDALSFLCNHLYGICPLDPVTPNCPPGTAPEDCDGPECGVDVETWVCEDPPDEPSGIPDPFVTPPIPVKIDLPPARLGCSSGQPPFNRLVMTFGEIPAGGSVIVNASLTGFSFTEGFTQTISAPGDLTWTVENGPNFIPGGNVPVFPTRDAWAAGLGPQYTKLYTHQGPMTFQFSLQLDVSAFESAGALLDILMYFWATGYSWTYVC